MANQHQSGRFRHKRSPRHVTKTQLQRLVGGSGRNAMSSVWRGRGTVPQARQNRAYRRLGLGGGSTTETTRQPSDAMAVIPAGLPRA